MCSLLASMTEENLSKHTIDEVLSLANVSKDEYYKALSSYRTKASITYKRGLTDTLISPYNTPILATLKANMNIQFITGIYAVLAYLTSYLCKPEHSMGELMKNLSNWMHTTHYNFVPNTLKYVIYLSGN